MRQSAITRPPALVGHRGAAALAPENTVAGFRAALNAGVDAIEFDVRRGPRGDLVLAHGRRRARRRDALCLERALAFVHAEAPSDLELLIDVKEPATEAAIVGALRAAGVLERVVACAREPLSLARLAEEDSSLRRAWSLKRPRHAAPGRLGLARRDVPRAVAAAVRSDLATAVTVHRSLATPQLVDAAHSSGGMVYAWDVTRVGDGVGLACIGVDALIVDDPRPFQVLRAAR
jgi:glycerophosphoryl diester phosphodiesterase